MIDTSVVVCTYNRKELLAQCLASLLDQDYPKDRYEILVMENNCTDGTIDLVQSFATRQALPQLNLHRVNKQGLSYARNLGIELARGRSILFIDDDAVARPDWISRMVNVLQDPTVSAVGGTVILRFLAPRPRWMTKKLLGGLSEYLPRHDHPYPILRRPYPVGCNIGFKAEALKDLGGFNTSLGRVGLELSGGEEMELFDRLLTSGGRLVVCPKAIVEHLIGPDRVTKGYFFRLKQASAKQQIARLGPIGNAKRILLLGWYTIDLVFDVAVWLILLAITMSKDRAFHRQLHVVRAITKVKTLLAHRSRPSNDVNSAKTHPGSSP